MTLFWDGGVWGSATAVAPITPATGATVGAPGVWTPTGAAAPANLAALQSGGVAATPSTAWVSGSYVVLGDATNAYWNGTAWASGTAP